MLPYKIVNGNAQRERRRRPRLKLAYPLRLYRPGEAFRTETVTENISCDGFFCVTRRAFHSGETLPCEVVIPGEKLGETSVEDMVLSCRAYVVRVVPWNGGTTFGVACRVMDYTIGALSTQRFAVVEWSKPAAGV